ncbi:unnamed protein product [Sphagnum balticum]
MNHTMRTGNTAESNALPCGDKSTKIIPINARLETLQSNSVTYRHALNNRQRCVVVADGGLRAREFEYFISFYEWQTLAGGVKQPYYIYMKDAVKKEEDDDAKTPIKPAHAHITRQPMFFAAIYEHSLVHEDVGREIPTGPELFAVEFSVALTRIVYAVHRQTENSAQSVGKKSVRPTTFGAISRSAIRRQVDVMRVGK